MPIPSPSSSSTTRCAGPACAVPSTRSASDGPGPTLVHAGTEAQKERYLLPLLAGEEIWCQLFSEPGAGSDLAGLSTRAVRDGDEWVVTGQKVWTSFAHIAALGILLARTDPDAPKHQGISYFVCPMDAPGVTIRPIVDMTGDHAFNEVFLDEVRLPAQNLVGEVNGGWALAKVTLGNERVSLSGEGALWGQGPTVGDLLDIVRRGGGVRDARLRQRLARLWIEGEVLRLIRLRTVSAVVAGRAPGPEASVRKALADDHGQRVMELAQAMAGTFGMLADAGPADGLGVGDLVAGRGRGRGRGPRRGAVAVPGVGQGLSLLEGAHHRRRHRRGAAQHHRRACARATPRRRRRGRPVVGGVAPRRSGLRLFEARRAHGPLDDTPDEGGEGVGMAERRAVGGPGDLDDLGVGDEVGQRVDGAPVVRDRGPAASEDQRHAQLRQVEGRAVPADVGELGHEGGTVGLAIGARLVGQAVPPCVAHHTPEEPFGEGGRVLIGDARGGAARPPLAPWERGLVGTDGTDDVRGLDGRAQRHVTAVGMAHHDRRPVAHQRHEVGDVVVEGAGQGQSTRSGGSRAGRR